ncbi:MAG: cyclodeaminase/cyclohydrolase family protein [Candidatus Thermoplasmatota archaeon]|nr:cyclodeaminase/cyclohydrolase family protein [Candidatus Thermoplasmatota archaeon]
MMADERINEFIQNLASGAPTPGGGSAAALGGAIASALSEMVCNLTIGKEKYAAVEKQIGEEKEKLISCRKRLLEIVDEDAKAFDEVMKAFKMPKDEDARKDAIQEAYKLAASVPMETAERCMEILEHAEVIAKMGNKNSITDAGTSALLAHASLKSALFNVKINLSGIKNEAFRKEMEKKTKFLEKNADKKLESVNKIVEEQI